MQFAPKSVKCRQQWFGWREGSMVKSTSFSSGSIPYTLIAAQSCHSRTGAPWTPDIYVVQTLIQKKICKYKIISQGVVVDTFHLGLGR